MANRCKVCSHPDREEINRQIANYAAFRGIAAQYKKDFSDDSVRRHAENCLQEAIGIVRKQNLVKQGIQFHGELVNILDKANKLLRAADRFLTDPTNPDEYTLDPRCSDVDVVYLDFTDRDHNENPRRKKEVLRELLEQVAFVQVESLARILDRIEANHEFPTIEDVRAELVSYGGEHKRILSVQVKQQDRADVLLKAIAQVSNQLRLYGESAGLFKAPEVDEVETIAQDIRRLIEQRAKEKQVPFREELQNYLDNYSENVRGEVKERLAMELVSDAEM